MNRIEHVLTCVAEECDEVGQRVCKALRFGLSEVQPDQPLTNAERIHVELCDLYGAAMMLVDEGIIEDFRLATARESKRARIEHYMRHAESTGALTP